MKKAWYLGLAESDVGDRAILVGDPDRVGRIAEFHGGTCISSRYARIAVSHGQVS